MNICDFHNKKMCHLPELQERRQKKKENGNLYAPLHFKAYDECKMWDDLESKQNCSSFNCPV